MKHMSCNHLSRIQNGNPLGQLMNFLMLMSFAQKLSIDCMEFVQFITCVCWIMNKIKYCEREMMTKEVNTMERRILCGRYSMVLKANFIYICCRICNVVQNILMWDDTMSNFVCICHIFLGSQGYVKFSSTCYSTWCMAWNL